MFWGLSAPGYLPILSLILFLLFPIARAAASPQPAPLSLDEAPEFFVPRQPRSESDRDRIEALSLWAAGRAHQHKEEFPEALRCCQRALRLDPQSLEIVHSIVALADRLQRYAVAARYALLEADLPNADPMVLRRLGVYLSGEGDPAGAAKLYEKAVAVRKDADQSAADVFLRMELGRLYFMLEQYARAADCFAVVLDALDHPDKYSLDEHLKNALLVDAGRTCQLLGDCFLAADRPELARAAFDKAARYDTDQSLQQYNQARLLQKTGKPAEALTALEASFAAGLAGQGIDPYQTLADALNELGRKDELIGRLEKMRAAEPDNLPLGYFLAARLREAGDAGGAETLYRKLLDARPASTGYRELADIFQRAKRYDELLSLMGESVDKIGVLNTFDGREQALSGNAETMSGIIAAAKNKTAGGSGKLDFHTAYAVAILALETKQFETAEEFFNLAVAADPQRADETLTLWGVGLLWENRPARAATVFQRAINDQTVAPMNRATFNFYLAGALALEGQADEALAAARTAAEAKPLSPRFRGRPAWVLYYCKRRDEAFEAYRKLIDEFDDDHASAETREVMREARMALSSLAAAKGDVPQAEEWIEQVLDEFPDDVGAINDLGYLWAERGKNLVRAERMIRRAVAAEPKNAAFRDSLGWILFQTGKYPQALAELEIAAAGGPGGVVLDHLGDAYLKTGRREQAVQAWRKAAEAFRKENEPHKQKLIEEKILQNAK